MGDEYRVGIYETLAEYTSLNPKRVLFVVIGFAILCDIGCAVALNVFMDGPLNLKSHAKDFPTFFYNNTADCLYLAICRSTILPLLAFYAARTADESNTNPVIACQCFKCFYPSNSHRLLSQNSSTGSQNSRNSWDSHGEIGQPLLSTEKQEGAQEGDRDDVDQEEGYEAEDQSRKFELALLHEDSATHSMEDTALRQNLWLGALFTLSVATQIYVGLKCISFNFTAENNKADPYTELSPGDPLKSVVGALMGLAVLWANILSWSLRELVSKGYRHDGELVSALHPHRLHLHATVAGHWCDVCSTQVKDGKAYRCKLCDFDLCLRCFARRGTLTMEGLMRGDKGVKQETEMNSWGYVQRGIELVRSEYILFSLALLCLALFNLLSLLLPRLQGTILDAVVNDRQSRFNSNILLYLYVSIATGFFGGLQSLCFSVVGRKVAKTVRCRLFRGIISQDIAFFDGNSSGQLSSRLTNDVSFMVQPIQSMMGSLLSNSILLIGGIAMCFVTSWQLSLLAFTTIGPIIHITQVYARWSSHLNRQIFSALASANGFATEALSNIRTVKAFTTEALEEDKYTDAIVTALQKGIRDALGGAGMYAINSYLDLGAGVLILWYGGNLAMGNGEGGGGGLTPGQLITFQLYWTLINSAYKGLIDILTSFTRSAGAASRIFSLMDALPDIDPDSGTPLSREQIFGGIEFRGVGFRYQMRPDLKVLEGVQLLIRPGTTCALVGKSGGGKSTMINLILRFYDPKEGEILLDGRQLTTLKLRDVRREIGLVAQNTELFAGSIEDNISYGMPPGSFTRQDIIAAARKACAHEFICQMAEGYATRVGERGVRISGGQKQRIAIARVFLRKPKILLLDEATSALDAESEAKVQEALDRLIAEGGATVVLVAHRLSTVVNADQIAVVGEGRILETGDHETLLKAEGPYARLVRKQLAKHSALLPEQEEQEDEEELEQQERSAV